MAKAPEFSPGLEKARRRRRWEGVGMGRVVRRRWGAERRGWAGGGGGKRVRVDFNNRSAIFLSSFYASQ